MNDHKLITKTYDLTVYATKQTLTHNIMLHRISPDNSHSHYNSVVGNITHNFEWENRSLGGGFGGIDCNKIPKPLEFKKKNWVQILLAKGNICSNLYCGRYESDIYQHTIPKQIFKEFKAISNRTELAKFLRKIKKEGVKITSDHICASCKRREDKERKEREDEERYEKILKKYETRKPVNMEEKKERNKTPFLYIMKCQRTGYYKIGQSKNPTQREKTLQAESPTIIMVASFKGKAKYEKILHGLYSDYRLRGEWFNLSKAQVRFICETMKKSKGEIDYLLFKN